MHRALITSLAIAGSAAVLATGLTWALVQGARLTFFDGYGRETASYAAGETVRVRVVDHNRNDAQAQDTLNVQLSSRDGGDGESDGGHSLGRRNELRNRHIA